MTSTTSLHVREHGHGRPVLALHDACGTGFQWLDLADRLSEGIRVMAPDLHGHGRSPDWPARAIASMDIDADPLAGLVREAKLPVHLVGHGHGGALALFLALRFPTRVSALTLVDPMPLGLLARIPQAQAWAREAADFTAHVESLLRAGRVHAATRTHICYWRGPLVWAVMTAAERNIAAARMHVVARQTRAALSAAWAPQRLASLDMPVRLLQQRHTHHIARILSAQLLSLIPRSRLQVLDAPGGQDAFALPAGAAAAIAAHVEAEARVDAQAGPRSIVGGSPTRPAWADEDAHLEPLAA